MDKYFVLVDDDRYVKSKGINISASKLKTVEVTKDIYNGLKWNMISAYRETENGFVLDDGKVNILLNTKLPQSPMEQLRTDLNDAKAVITKTFQAQIIMDRASKTNAISDTVILDAASFIDYPKYENSYVYKVGQIIQKGGLFYEVKATHTSNSVAYPVETTFAYYRLIEMIHTGTLHDPIPYPETAGIVVSVVQGKYYSYKGKKYLAKADLPNCVWVPDSGIWQWEAVSI